MVIGSASINLSVPMNQLIYNASGGGDFIEAALNAWGIGPEIHVENTAKRIRAMFHGQEPFP